MLDTNQRAHRDFGRLEGGARKRATTSLACSWLVRALISSSLLRVAGR